MKNTLTKISQIVVTLLMCFALLPHHQIHANENARISVGEKTDRSVTLNEEGYKWNIKFLDDSTYRVQKVTSNQDFLDYATTPKDRQDAKIIIERDEEKAGPSSLNVTSENGVIKISTVKLTIEIDQASTKMTVKNAANQVVLQQEEPITIAGGRSVETLTQASDEYFYGGGTQNGRFSHKGKSIQIVNTNNWVDGGVASPNPFYFSTKGYGIVRNTFKPGKYDFINDKVVTSHNDNRYDAYVFVGNNPKEILQHYVDLTGKPAQLPEYAFYLGHLNCYNRDYWLPVQQGGVIIDGNRYQELQPSQINQNQKASAKLESLMPQDGNDTFTAKHQIELYEQHDMPLGWFLPNDGYGCGYGQDKTSLDNNIQNLKNFSDYAKSKGVTVGLWTQSNLTPMGDNPILQRDFEKEVHVAGVRSLKTDVAWVGAGYTFGLNGLEKASKILDRTGERKNIVTLDGWAGTQRYGGIWTGDQYGGKWEYIRFHLPTLITTGLSGNPNVGTDMDGIFGGGNEVIAMRDLQYKTFAGYMLNMDGWGHNPKNPWYFGDRYQSINRGYLKLKAMLMPYTATYARHAHLTGVPMLRAMMLDYPNEYTYGEDTRYQFMWGDSFLVAPIYQETNMDDRGNDIRNNIYLPENETWIDYITGDMYKGGQVLNQFAAPIYKLPVFVKYGAIIPMYPENNNPEPITDSNLKGLDRSQRIFDVYPAANGEFTLYEDDGKSLNGPSLNTHVSYTKTADNLTLTIDAASGTKGNLTVNKSTELLINADVAPSSVTGSVNGSEVTFTKVENLRDYLRAEGNVYFFDEHPQSFINKYANSNYNEIPNVELTPKLRVKSAEKSDITAHNYVLRVDGFRYAEKTAADVENSNLAVPTNLREESKTSTSITVAFDAVENATSYDLLFDGRTLTGITTTSFTIPDLRYSSDHTFKVRAVNAEGHSAYSDEITIRTNDDPYRNIPKNISARANINAQSGQGIEKLFDHDLATMWHTSWSDPRFNELTIDLNGVYDVERLVYIPRDDAGNGTITSAKLSVSIDGVHYVTLNENLQWQRNNQAKEIRFDEISKFRYIKFSNVRAAGGFGSGREIEIYAKDPIKRSEPGDYNNSGDIDEGDMTFFENYAGLSRLHKDSDFEGYVEAADVNFNNVIDATDIQFVTRRLEGGLSYYPGQHSQGNITVVPSKSPVAEGETFYLDLYGINMQRVNGFSAAIDIDLTKYEVLGYQSTLATIDMKNFSNTRLHSDGKTTANVIYVNVGDKALINGSEKLARVMIKSKANQAVDLSLASALIVNSSMEDDDALLNTAPIEEEVIEAEGLIPATDYSTISIKTEAMEEYDADGTTIWQQGNWKDRLTNGNKDNGQLAEFKWYYGASSNATYPEAVTLPANIKFEFNNPKVLTAIKVYNRVGQNSNGAVRSIKASYIDESDVEHEISTIASYQEVYTFNLDTPVRAKAYIVTPLTSNGTMPGIEHGSENNRMLSLREIEAVELTNEGTTAINLDNFDAEMRIGTYQLKEINVSPEHATDRIIDLVANNDKVAITKVNFGDRYKYLVTALAGGEVELTATLASKPEVTATKTITIIDTIDTRQLESIINDANTILAKENLFNKVNIEAMKAALIQAQEVLEAANNQDAIDQSAVKLADILRKLKFVGNADLPKLTHKITPVTVVSVTSETDGDVKEHMVDGLASTIWHSEWRGNVHLPVEAVFDLGTTKTLGQLTMLPRQGSRNGHIIEYIIEGSNDGINFFPINAGYIENNGRSITEPETAKLVRFPAVNTRYVKIIATKTLGDANDKYASLAEVEFFDTDTTGLLLENSTNTTFELTPNEDHNGLKLEINDETPLAKKVSKALIDAKYQEGYNLNTYEIKLINLATGEKIANPETPVEIRINLTEEQIAHKDSLKVFHVSEENELEEIAHSFDQDNPNVVVFSASKFSPYIILTGARVLEVNPKPNPEISNLDTSELQAMIKKAEAALVNITDESEARTNLETELEVAKNLLITATTQAELNNEYQELVKRLAALAAVNQPVEREPIVNDKVDNSEIPTFNIGFSEKEEKVVNKSIPNTGIPTNGIGLTLISLVTLAGLLTLRRKN